MEGAGEFIGAELRMAAVRDPEAEFVTQRKKYFGTDGEEEKEEECDGEEKEEEEEGDGEEEVEKDNGEEEEEDDDGEEEKESE